MKLKMTNAGPALLLALGILAGCGDRETTQAERSVGDQRAEAPRATTDTARVPDARTPGTDASGATSGTNAAGTAQQPDQQTIRQAEQQLQAAGFNPGTVDGVVDKDTREAVRKFQQENKLEATGELNQDTLLALKAEGGAGKPGGAKAQ
jgi:peptidoglycan hydrolase-like protein with peptidoglycan-binding domain